MHEDFWNERWKTGRIGFHEAQPNTLLTTYVDRLLEATQAARAEAAQVRPSVLVPLSGKSNDLAFLASRGFAVTGIEFVRQAAEAFFEERALGPEVERWQGFDALSANGVRIAVGDFFALSVPEAERFDTAYDRAALIAVRPEERERYVATCLAALRPGARLLVVTLDFGDAPLAGPPFGVSERDVRRLYADAKVEALAETDISASEGLRERGASRVLEQAWLVRLPG